MLNHSPFHSENTTLVCVLPPGYWHSTQLIAQPVDRGNKKELIERIIRNLPKETLEKSLERIFDQVKVPVNILGDNLRLVEKTYKIFQILFSKEYLGKAEESGSFILNGFNAINKLVGEAIPIVVDDLPDGINGKFFCDLPAEPLKIVLDRKKIDRVNLFKPKSKKFKKIQGTILHEMTHALFWYHFNIAHSSLFIQREIGETLNEFKEAVKQFANLASKQSKWKLWHTAADEIKENFSQSARLAKIEDSYSIAFNEFLAQIPSTYLMYSESYSIQEIDDALKEIFPLGHRVFWNEFKTKSQELEEIVELTQEIFQDLMRESSFTLEEKQFAQRFHEWRSSFFPFERSITISLCEDCQSVEVHGKELKFNRSFLKNYSDMPKDEQLKCIKEVMQAIKETFI